MMVACGKTGAGNQTEGQKVEVAESYTALDEAISTFTALDSGTLRMVIEQNQNHKEANGQSENPYKNVETKTIKFVRSGDYYNFIETDETDETEERDVPVGYKQKDGIRTFYNYMAYDNGTFQWGEGIAELDQYGLPEEIVMAMQLPNIEFIEDIHKGKSGKLTKYTLVLTEGYFDYAERSSEYSSYELNQYDISYFLNKNNQLSSIFLDKSEFWIQSENYNVEQTTTYDIALIENDPKVNMDYFTSSGTYKKPIYDEITEIWREEFINIPETYIFDVRVPRLKQDLPNADKINQKIAADCSLALNATEDDLISEGEWGGYPWHTVDFAVYRFGDIYQICIFNTEASAWGSGIGMWLYTYYYDINLGDVISQEDFLVNMNYTPEEIVEIFYQDYLSEIDMENSYTYDEISNWYYFDGDAKIQFYVNLFG